MAGIENESPPGSFDLFSDIYLGSEPGQAVHPFMYEPEASSDDEPIEEDDTQRLENTDWCSCFNCQAMPRTVECVCCQEIEEVKEKIEDVGVQCIIDHPGFNTICLNEWVLQIAYSAYRHQYGSGTYEGTVNEQRRHTAYRQLTWLCWGWLGRNIRVSLPSCAVTKIRLTFPSENYVGFNYPNDSQ